mgnify:CR=1 FL=1
MQATNTETLNKAIEKLAEKAKDAPSSEAMQFAQAALNLAYAVEALNSIR